MSSPEFYNKTKKALNPGIIVDAPFLFLDNQSPLILRYDVENHPELLEPPPLTPSDPLPDLGDVNLLRNPMDAFSDHNPELKKLGLMKKEEFVVYKAKKRPGIILSGFDFNKDSDTIIAVPMFTLEKRYISDTIKNEVRKRTHPYYFYLPASTEYGIEESFADFSQLQVINKARVSIRNVCLSMLAVQALFLLHSGSVTPAFDFCISHDSTESKSG
ncbi:hypothetical protein ACTID9_21810 [Brevibacillus fluminis]|uniref:hypothetical protein n=1 Tax=Brevibacillus fluminis TaxID=511487 RepID=UPI003F8BB73A